MPAWVRPSAVFASHAAPSVGLSLDELAKENCPELVQHAATVDGAICGGGGASGNNGTGLLGASAKTGDVVMLKISAV